MAYVCNMSSETWINEMQDSNMQMNIRASRQMCKAVQIICACAIVKVCMQTEKYVQIMPTMWLIGMQTALG